MSTKTKTNQLKETVSRPTSSKSRPNSSKLKLQFLDNPNPEVTRHDELLPDCTKYEYEFLLIQPLETYNISKRLSEGDKCQEVYLYFNKVKLLTIQAHSTPIGCHHIHLKIYRLLKI